MEIKNITLVDFEKVDFQPAEPEVGIMNAYDTLEAKGIIEVEGSFSELSDKEIIMEIEEWFEKNDFEFYDIDNLEYSWKEICPGKYDLSLTGVEAC